MKKLKFNRGDITLSPLKPEADNCLDMRKDGYNIVKLKKVIYICLIMQKIVDIHTSFRRRTLTATFTMTTL